MKQILVHLIAGALGGHAAARLSPFFDLGTTGNACAGLAGGSGFGQLIALLLPFGCDRHVDRGVEHRRQHDACRCRKGRGAVFAALIGSIQNKAA